MIYNLLLCLGDSLTCGARDRYMRNYPLELAKELSEITSEEWYCITEAVNGRTSSELATSAYSIVNKYSDVYGVILLSPRQKSKGGSGVLAIFTERALQNEPLSIFGSGNQSRDFVYVGDVVRANIQAALSNQANGQIFNIGSGKDTTVIELAQKIISLTNSQSLIEYLPARVADFKDVNIDIKQAKDLIGWQPLTSLDSGLTNYIEWLVNIAGEKIVQSAEKISFIALSPR
jgi:nucleoside-diphosphate-sugar epimerase